MKKQSIIFLVLAILTGSLNAQVKPFKKADRIPADSSKMTLEVAYTINGQNSSSALSAVSPFQNNPLTKQLSGLSSAMDKSMLNLVLDEGKPIFIEKIKEKSFSQQTRMMRSPSVSKREKISAAHSEFNNFAFENKSQLKLNAPDRQIRIKEITEESPSQISFKGEQTVEGIPVYGAEFTYHITDKTERFLGRTIDEKMIIADSKEDIGISDAVKIAEQDLSKQVNFKKFNDFEKKLLNYDAPESEKIFYPQSDKKYHLTYKISIRPNLMDEWIYYVDAKNGSIIHKYNNTKKNGPVVSSGIDLLGVQRPLNTYLDNGTYLLVNASKSMYNPADQSGVIMTYDANNTQLKTVSLVSSTNNTWTNAAAVSAHANADLTYNYWDRTFKRMSFDNKKGDMISVVNLGDANGYPEDNAYWNGRFTAYGGGGGALRKVAGGLDAVAHEFGHAVVSATANLEYQGQSGAINETYADISGAMVDRDDWKIGEDVVYTTNYPSGAMRDMANPHNGGYGLNSPGWQPAHVSEMYLGTQDNGGVHINSGITNHAFYLYATKTSKDKAEQVFYRALFNYLTTTSKFIDLRIATCQAAKDLYGSTDSTYLAQAFDRVGITDPRSTPSSGSGGGGGTPGTVVGEDLAVNPGSEVMLLNRYNYTYQSYTLHKTTDGNNFTQLTTTKNISRPSVTDDGSAVVFVNSQNQLCVLYPNTNEESVLSSDSDFESVVVSKDGSRIAAISKYQDGKIYVYDFGIGRWASFQLYNPTTGTTSSASNKVNYADAMEFDNTGEFLIYDSYNTLTSTTAGTSLEYWDIGVIHVWDKTKNNYAGGEISKPFGDLPEGASIGNPTFAKNSPYIIAFDYMDNNNTYAVLAANFLTQEIKGLFNNSSPSYPSYGIDDKSIALESEQNSSYSVYMFTLGADKMSIIGNEIHISDNAYFPVLYGTGKRVLGLKPTVDFTADKLNVAPNEQVLFLDNSLNRPVSWQWTFEGGVPATSTSQYPRVSYRSNGTFKVTLRASNEYGIGTLTKEKYITVMPTSAKTIESENLRIYPNPAKEFFTIIGLQTSALISLIDISGKIVLNQQVKPNEEISTSGISNGIYIIKIDDKAGKLVIDK